MSADILSLMIGEDDGDTRLDKALATAFAGQFSRERLKALIAEGAVTLNGQPCTKPASPVHEGDRIVLHAPPPEPVLLEPEPIALAVIYEDREMLVINKPRGMLSHPTGAQRTGTLVNAALHHCQGQLSGINGLIRPGIVHRLDRDTTGLMMIAKTDRAHRHLAAQLQQRTATRAYQAVIQGCPQAETGVIDAPIARHPTHRNRMTIHARGRFALTRWQVIERIHGRFAHLRLHLETGRTHQIRVHLASRGHPVLGDAQYGQGIERQIHLPTPGQLLQADCLRFLHPLTQAPMAFEIPQDPAIAAALAFLRAR